MLSVRSRPRAPRSHLSPAHPCPFPETPCPLLLHQRAPCTDTCTTCMAGGCEHPEPFMGMMPPASSSTETGSCRAQSWKRRKQQRKARCRASPPPLAPARSPGCPRGFWGPLSYPHAVALEDVVAVERRGVQGAGRRLVLDGAGERGRAGTQTLGHLRARGGAARNEAGGRLVRTDGQTDRHRAWESGFHTLQRSSDGPNRTLLTRRFALVSRARV